MGAAQVTGNFIAASRAPNMLGAVLICSLSLSPFWCPWVLFCILRTKKYLWKIDECPASLESLGFRMGRSVRQNSKLPPEEFPIGGAKAFCDIQYTDATQYRTR
jgi:hypothetical protein